MDKCGIYGAGPLLVN